MVEIPDAKLAMDADGLVEMRKHKFENSGLFAGGIALRRSKGRPLRVMVIPLRARSNVAELPWLGLRIPVAMITISDPGMAKRPKS